MLKRDWTFCLQKDLKGECPHIWFLDLRDFLAVLFTFLGELQLWFVNLQPMIKVMLILAFLSMQANSVL